MHTKSITCTNGKRNRKTIAGDAMERSSMTKTELPDKKSGSSFSEQMFYFFAAAAAETYARIASADFPTPTEESTLSS